MNTENIPSTDKLYSEIAELLKSARQTVTSQVNTVLLATYWNVGRMIEEDEQKSQQRAEYGKQVLQVLSRRLTNEFGKGFSRPNLYWMRQLYIKYPICQTLSNKLSWSHYCELLTIADDDKRAFYEKDRIEIHTLPTQQRAIDSRSGKND